MPSAALLQWQGDRLPRLALVEAHCTALYASVAPPAVAPLALESLQAYLMLLSAHFQGFCRDLYSECSQLCALSIGGALEPIVQAQFNAEIRLNAANANIESLRKDFERFGFRLDFVAIDPANALRVTHLGHLNHWRNIVSHQKTTPPPAGMPPTLTLADVQTWKSSCAALATALDGIMLLELTAILGHAPW